MRRSPRSRNTGGFTLLETTIATVIFAVVGYSVSLTVDMSNDSNSTVAQTAKESRTQRKTVSALLDDVRNSANARITVTTDPSGNTLVQLQQPVTIAGAFAWGVRDRRLGDDEDTWNRQDWTVRYLVDSDGRLLRRVADVAGVTQLEDVLADDIVTAVGTPGFRMTRTGAVWNVRTRVRPGGESSSVSQCEFHIRTRN